MQGSEGGCLQPERSVVNPLALLALLTGALVVSLIATAPAVAKPSPPVPGGKYVGSSQGGDGRNLKVKVNVAAVSDRTTLRGRVRYRCARVAARFELEPDGSFVARRENRKGRTIFKATGSFDGMDEADGRVERLAKSRRKQRCGPGGFTAKLRRSAPIEERTISYGPFDTKPTGGHGEHGAGGGNVVMANLEKPCEDCMVVGILPELREADGSRANFDTGSMMHHAVFQNRSETDSTCANRNQRFFASGNERSPFLLPQGYGYRIDADADWRLITHLMNMGEHAKDLFIELTFYTVPDDGALEGVTPMWLDINNCGNSEYMTPAGLHAENWDWKVPPALEGDLVAIGGHQHDYGTRITVSNMSRGETICDVRPGYDNDPSYMGHIESVGGCSGRPLATLKAGERLRLRSEYDAPEPIHDVMGIMVGYVDPAD